VPMSSLSSGFYRVGFVVTLVTTAFLAGLQAGGSGSALAPPAQAEGSTVTVGGRNAGGGTADSDKNMIAVTGTSSTGAAVLYLIETREKRLSVYHSSGKNIELVAARNIEFDLKIDAYRDSSDEEVQVRRLRSDWLKSHGAKPAGGKEEGK